MDETAAPALYGRRMNNPASPASAFRVFTRFLGLATLPVLCSVASAALLYDQPFDNNTGSGKSITYASGWSGYMGSSATATSNANAIIQNIAGTGDGSLGRIYTSFTSSNPIALVGTALSLDLSGGAAEIVFDTVQSSTLARLQVLIQLNDSTWYISNTVITPSTSSTLDLTIAEGTRRQTLAFTTSASAWSDFTLTAGSTMSVGSTLLADLPGSTITGIGFYLTNTHPSNGVTVRIDTLAVSAIPEPGTWALFAGATALGAVGLRRRRRD